MAEVFRKTATNTLVLTDTIVTVFTDIHINASWVRWIYASINKHFDNHKGDLPIYIEGDERTQNDREDFVELRIDGPFIKTPHKGLRYLDVEINLLIQSVLDPKDLYKVQRVTGIFSHAFTNLIEVYKYGNGPIDDNTLLGCFHAQRDLKEGIAINYFGIIRQDTRITQATIEGHYRLELS